MSLYNAEITIVGAGGGGGRYCGGGGGGGQVSKTFCSFNNTSLCICIGKGGYGGGTANNSCPRGLDGEYTCILYKDGTPFDYAKGGNGASCSIGGLSGNGNPNIGGGYNCYAGGGGGGAGEYGLGIGTTGTYCRGGCGGEGKYGYGGGGGGGSRCCGCACRGLGKDGGGDGGYYGNLNGFNGTNGGGGGGAAYGIGGNGGDGLVIIKYANDGSYGINDATGGTKEVGTCFTTHTFTSDGTFTIVS